jgi:hypothetical protein
VRQAGLHPVEQPQERRVHDLTAGEVHAVARAGDDDRLGRVADLPGTRPSTGAAADSSCSTEAEESAIATG